MKLTLSMPPVDKKRNDKTIILTCILIGLCIFLSMAAQAGDGGTQFSSIWTEISGWADGVPGKIVTLLAFFAALFNVLKQNWYMAIGAFIGAMVLSQSVTIVNTFLTGVIL